MDELINVCIKIVVTLVLMGAIYLGKWLIAWLKSKLDIQEAARLDKFVTELVSAAEQMFKHDDPSGENRLGYVQGMLMEAGYDLTDAVRALIEAKVFEINNIGGATNGQQTESN